MRILHTSDWHLGAKLGPISRQPHIVARLGQIAGYLEEHRVDVMVVSGDLFDRRRSRADELRQLWDEVRLVFEPFVCRGGTIVAICGNHDHEALFDLLQSVQRLTAPVMESGVRTGGRLYLGSKPSLLRLADRGGQVVQFALLPYPTPDRYPAEADDPVESGEDRNRRLQRLLSRKLEQLQRCLDETLPSVLVSHVHVRGVRAHNLYDISEREDVIFDSALLGTFAYAAYGHIHKPQPLSDSHLRRYAGSLERMNLGELSDDKSVFVCDITAEGAGTWQVLPLSATPMADETIRDVEADLERIAARHPDPETILYYALEVPSDKERGAIHRAVQRRFRNAIPHLPAAPSSLVSARREVSLVSQIQDWRETVVGYLAAQLGSEPYQALALDRVRGLMDRLEDAP